MERFHGTDEKFAVHLRVKNGSSKTIRRDRKKWSWLTAEQFQVAGPQQVEFSLNAYGHYLAMYDIVRTDGETVIPGLQRSVRKDLRNVITFVPAGRSVQGWSKHRPRTCHLLAVHLEPTAEELRELEIEALPLLHVENATLRATLAKFQPLLTGDIPDDPAYAETLGLLLMLELRDLQSSKGLRRLPAHGGLTPRQIGLIKDFIDAKITSQQISLTELANLLGLSKFHFIRAFKKSSGMSPYQYILSERVELAKEMLARSGILISDIATAVGFSNSLQLARVFRKFVGMTPSEYRRVLDRN